MEKIYGKSFIELLQEYYLYVIIGAVILVTLIALIVVLCVVHKKKKNKQEIQKTNQAIDDIILGLGGIENIDHAEAKGSRLNVYLKDFTLLDEDKIKSAGVSSIIKMTTKVTLIVGYLSEDISKQIGK